MKKKMEKRKKTKKKKRKKKKEILMVKFQTASIDLSRVKEMRRRLKDLKEKRE